MKKTLLVLAASLALGASAQSNLEWKVVGGMNVSSMTDFDSKVGFHVGAKAQLGLPKVVDGMYVNAGALLSLKGAKLDWGDLGNETINSYYLDIPIHVGYKYNVNENFSIFGEVGPYFSIGLFGKTKVEQLTDDYGGYYDGPYDGITTEKFKTNTFSDDGLKRFDFGLGISAGVEFKQKYSLTFGYDWGLLDVLQDPNDGADEDYPLEDEEIDLVTKMKNGNFYITFGYTF